MNIIQAELSVLHPAGRNLWPCITDEKTCDVEIGHALQFPRGSIVVIDRDYNDYS